MAKKITLPPHHVVERWKERHVIKWLKKVDLEDCVIPFEKRHIDGPKLLELTEQKLFTYQDLKIKHRSQIAKCVKDCKAQASNARRIVKNTRHSQEISDHASVTNGACESDYDDDSMEWDTDFEDDCEDDVNEEENTPKELNNNNAVSEQPPVESDVPEKCSASENNNNAPRTKYIPKPPDLPLITKSAANTGQQPVVSLRNNASRPPLKRPPSQPPPPPVPQPSSQDEPQEDYEVPINPSAASFSGPENNTSSTVAAPSPAPSVSSSSTTELPSLPSKPCLTESISFSSETYEIIETPEENYEIVDEKKWTASPVPVYSEKPALPPRLPLSTSGSPPPPPLPQKPRKLQENSHVQKTENFHSLPRPKLPVKSEDDTTENSASSGNVGTSILNSLLGRKYSATPSSSPKLHHYVKEVGGSDPTILSSVSSANDHLSGSSTPDKEGSFASVTHYKSLSASMSSVISELVKTNASPPPLPPRVPLTTAEDIAQSMATRPLPPVPVSATKTESDHPYRKEEAIHVHPWFHEIERQEAELLIKDLGQSGAFLVRPSKRAGKENPYTLTILHDEKVFHLNIRERSDGMFALGKEKKKEKSFLYVEELISYHQTEPIILTSRGESAGQTILRKSPSKQSG